MQYILTEQELKSGCELIKAWEEENLSIGSVYIRSRELNEQGYFTIIDCVDTKQETYKIIVMQRVHEII